MPPPPAVASGRLRQEGSPRRQPLLLENTHACSPTLSPCSRTLAADRNGEEGCSVTLSSPFRTVVRDLVAQRVAFCLNLFYL